MKSNTLITVIIPVYNAEKYLNNCVESIRSQTYKNIEILLVDDGSTDNSGLMCKEFAKVDNRIRVIHQKNSGPSTARNKGIEYANGEYLQFVDSDDFIDPNMISILINSMIEDIELVICGYKLVDSSKGKTIGRDNVPSIKGVYDNFEFAGLFGNLYRENLLNSPCNKMYVTEIIKKSNIKFQENINMGEDLLFNLEYIKACSRISIVQNPLYYYYSTNNHSLTGSFKKNYFENQILLYQMVKRFLIENNSYNQLNRELIGVTFINNIVGCISNLFHRDSNLDSNNVREQIKLIINNKFVQENIGYKKGSNIQTRIMGYLIKYQSVNGIYFIIKLKELLRNNMKPIFYLLRGFK